MLRQVTSLEVISIRDPIDIEKNDVENSSIFHQF